MEAHGFLEARGSRRLGGQPALRLALATPLPTAPAKPAEWALPNKPLLVLAPGEHAWTSPLLARWRARFETLGKVIVCPEAAGACADAAAMARTLLRKVQELRLKAPKRPIVLVGMSVGAKVAVMVAFKAKVDALVCLSLQLQGLSTAVAKCGCGPPSD